MLGPTLLPVATNIRLIQTRVEWDGLELFVAAVAAVARGAKCPCCGRVSPGAQSLCATLGRRTLAPSQGSNWTPR